MRPIDLSTATWRKSSYSENGQGGCIEVSEDFLASAAWRKSSYSENADGGCIEITEDFPALVPVRDSKNPHGPAVIFETVTWSSFVDAVKGGTLPA